jgi:hypothetical protein
MYYRLSVPEGSAATHLLEVLVADLGTRAEAR